MRKKGILQSAVILLFCILMLIPAVGCSEPPYDGQEGKYMCEYERGPMFSLDHPNYYYTLDGYGKGEYYHKNSTHKVKYTYNTDGTIYLTDTITGIKYNGTLQNGELIIYDGDKNNIMVTTFKFVKQ